MNTVVKEAAHGLDPETKNHVQGAIALLQKDAKDEAAASAEVAKYVLFFYIVSISFSLPSRINARTLKPTHARDRRHKNTRST
jgi:hypothetical protein